jgi:hypothetical protein
MTTIQPRIVEVRVGLAGQTGRVWRDLFIKARVMRVSGSTPNKAEVKLYNLNATSIKTLQVPNSTIQVLAGEGVPGAIFTGDIDQNSVSTTRQGPDIVTMVKATDGRRVYRDTRFIRSYPRLTTRTQVLADVIATMRVARGYIAPLSERVYQTARYYAAPARHVLDQLYAPDRAVWSIQGGALQVLAAGQAAPGNAPVISEQTGMIGIPKRDKNGIQVKSLFLGTVRPGDPFVVQSKIQGGDFKATKVTDDVDSDGGAWETDLVGVPLRPAA